MNQSINKAFEDRWYQSESVAAVFDYYDAADEPENGLILLPTGTGKSYVQAKIVHRAMREAPHFRIGCFVDSATLVKQNADELRSIWPSAPYGVYCAELNRRETLMPITFGSIQSVVKNLKAFGVLNFAIVDEAHMISPEEKTMYQKLYKHFKELNPFFFFIGMTATGYRLGQGKICAPGALFTKELFDATDFDSINRLLAEGFLAPLIPKRLSTHIDLSEVKIVRGEYDEHAVELEAEKITRAALEETVRIASDRKAWLLFASGIEHAEQCKDILTELGITCETVHSKKPKEQNDFAIEQFKKGRIRCLINYGKLTKGFNVPQIDLIIMLRATLSPGLWIQMLGRGTRTFFEKLNCLVLDFARNCAQLGPFNDPKIPKKKGDKGGDAPVRICERKALQINAYKTDKSTDWVDGCGTYNHASVKFCVDCKQKFNMTLKYNETSAIDELIATREPLYETFTVRRVSYWKHEKRSTGSVSFRVSYNVGLKKFDDYYQFGGKSGMQKMKAATFWRDRFPMLETDTIPETVDEAIEQAHKLMKPRKIRVHMNAEPYPTVVGYEY